MEIWRVYRNQIFLDIRIVLPLMIVTRSQLLPAGAHKLLLRQMASLHYVSIRQVASAVSRPLSRLPRSQKIAPDKL